MNLEKQPLDCPKKMVLSWWLEQSMFDLVKVRCLVGFFVVDSSRVVNLTIFFIKGRWNPSDTLLNYLDLSCYLA